MNGTLERPVEEKIESRKSVFTHEEENIFFSGVLRRYHLDAVGKADGQNQENALFLRGNGGQAGVLDSKNLALYSYAHQNPLIYIDPDGRKTWPVANTTIRIEPGNIFVGYFNALRPGNKGGLHRGVDIAGSIGDPVTATDTGIIVFAGYAGKKLGNVVRIETIVMNDDRTFKVSTSEVAHLKDVFVKTGDIIDEGNLVGTLGETGNAKNTSPHVHYSERNSKGVYRNPSSTYSAEERKQQSIPQTDYKKLGSGDDR